MVPTSKRKRGRHKEALHWTITREDATVNLRCKQNIQNVAKSGHSWRNMVSGLLPYSVLWDNQSVIAIKLIGSGKWYWQCTIKALTGWSKTFHIMLTNKYTRHNMYESHVIESHIATRFVFFKWWVTSYFSVLIQCRMTPIIRVDTAPAQHSI